MLFENDILKTYSKFTGEHPCRSAISIKLQSKFTEITLRHWCFPVNLLHIFRIPFYKNTSEGLLLNRSYTEAYLEHNQTSKMEIFSKIINGFRMNSCVTGAVLMSLLITLSMLNTILNPLPLL